MAAKEFRAVGRRKCSVARVVLKSGSDPITVNGRDLMTYFKNERLKTEVEKALKTVDKFGSYTVIANLNGGGLNGQAEALRLGIARALTMADITLRAPLKKAKLLTRDAREVERKKYGRAGARRRFQFSKR